jgi:hypothetical protein
MSRFTFAQLDIVDDYCKQREQESRAAGEELPCLVGLHELRALVDMSRLWMTYEDLVRSRFPASWR